MTETDVLVLLDRESGDTRQSMWDVNTSFMVSLYKILYVCDCGSHDALYSRFLYVLFPLLER